MRAETRLLRGVGLVLAAVLFSTGCASLPSSSGHGATLSYVPGPPPSQGLRAATVSLPEDSSSMEDEALLYRRLPTQTHGAGWGETAPLRAPQAAAAVCGDVPSGWPYLDSEEEVLTPFLGCTSFAAFVALQRTVDMPRLVESLSDWNAVRLGALGPLDAKASEILNRKRAAFLVSATEKYGLPRAEVFALFVLHTSFDDELRQLLGLLRDDKQLGDTLGQMAVVSEELQRRGLELSEYPDRAERAADVLRGLGRAGRDALSSPPVSDGSRYQHFTAMRAKLPPHYQAALDEVERALMERHYAPGSTALGAFDHLTFGVPVGFYHLVAGAGHGAYSAYQGKYEQATRELAPAAVVVAMYAGGKGARTLAESSGAGRSGLLRLAATDAEALKAVVKDLEGKLGSGAAGELFALIRGERAVGYFVAAEGLDGAIAIHEARGSVPKAQAMLAEAYRERPSTTSTQGGSAKRSSSTTVLPPESAGIAPEVAEARFQQVEAEAGGPRLPMDVALLKKHRNALQTAAPRGVEAHPLWPDYVSYLEKRTAEIEQGTAVKGPLEWAGYQACVRGTPGAWPSSASCSPSWRRMQHSRGHSANGSRTSTSRES
ncbi:hypothetical protein [Pyxidicoccus parkwayensis]|uniref:hypothetical protein n=1 Tax=Pyxidicoccus parkwayensis TaxID=2813578 RepID=UPI0027D96A37|nr:hypothetical protein [Pyxidicoccus parkwaysis]